MEKLREYLNSISTSEQKIFAKKCNTTIGYLRNAISMGKKFDVDLCISIVSNSNGCVRYEDLRPSTKWYEIRNSEKN